MKKTILIPIIAAAAIAGSAIGALGHGSSNSIQNSNSYNLYALLSNKNVAYDNILMEIHIKDTSGNIKTDQYKVSDTTSQYKTLYEKISDGDQISFDSSTLNSIGVRQTINTSNTIVFNHVNSYYNKSIPATYVDFVTGPGPYQVDVSFRANPLSPGYLI